VHLLRCPEPESPVDENVPARETFGRSTNESGGVHVQVDREVDILARE